MRWSEGRGARHRTPTKVLRSMSLVRAGGGEDERRAPHIPHASAGGGARPIEKSLGHTGAFITKFETFSGIFKKEV